jgi:hypothetical protein
MSARTCVACLRQAPPRAPLPGMNLMAICLIIYRPGKHGPVTTSAGSVGICEECLVKAFDGSVGQERHLLTTGIIVRLGSRYREIVEAEA